MNALPGSMTMDEVAQCAAKYVHRMQNIKQCRDRRRYSDDPAVREAFLAMERARFRRFYDCQKQRKAAAEAADAAEAAEAPAVADAETAKSLETLETSEPKPKRPRSKRVSNKSATRDNEMA